MRGKSRYWGQTQSQWSHTQMKRKTWEMVHRKGIPATDTSKGSTRCGAADSLPLGIIFGEYPALFKRSDVTLKMRWQRNALWRFRHIHLI